MILITAIVKNSTKRIDDKIFITQENIRSLKKDFENNKLEHDYLSSSEKLVEFQYQYFDNDLSRKNIQQIKIIKKSLNKLEIEKLQFINE